MKNNRYLYKIGRIVPVALVVILLLSITSGCRPANKPSAAPTTKTSADKILYFTNGEVVMSDLNGEQKVALLKPHIADEQLVNVRYFPKASTFVYMVANREGTFEQVSKAELRAYSVKTKQDTQIDIIDFIIASDDESFILYVKSDSPGYDKLMRYYVGKSVRDLKITGVGNGLLDQNKANLCYVGLSYENNLDMASSKIPVMNDLYVLNLKSLRSELITRKPIDGFVMPMRITPEHIIYAQSIANAPASAENVAVVLYDRETKKTRQLTQKTLSLGVAEKRKSLIAAKPASPNARSAFGIWEHSLDGKSQNKLFDISLKQDFRGGMRAILAPDEQKLIMSLGDEHTLGVYDFASKKYRRLVDFKDGSINDVKITPDGKSIIVVVTEPVLLPMALEVKKDVIYRVDIATGKMIPLTKPSKAERNESIRVIDVISADQAKGLNSN